MTMSTPHAKQPTAMRRASRITTSRTVDGTERATARSRGALEREHRRLSRLCAGLRENAEEAERAQGSCSRSSRTISGTRSASSS